MSEITMGEIWARRDELEERMAALLGHMLINLSGLDFSLGLCLVWVDGGANLQRLAKIVHQQSLKTRIDALTKHVRAKLPEGSLEREAYEQWISRTHAIRLQRNQLVHGRWVIEPQKNKVVNVIGLPSDDAQQITEYTIEELAAISAELKALEIELSGLRERWPL